MQPSFNDLTGLKIGRLLVLRRAPNGKRGITRWHCRCDCGKETTPYASTLRKAQNPSAFSANSHGTLSCGCLQREIATRVLLERNITHGQSRTTRYQMMKSAQARALRDSVPFDLSIDTFPVIPERCPVLGVRIQPNSRSGPQPSSPTLDRIIPSKGYVLGNVRIISHKANTIKNNGSLAEVAAVADYIRTSTFQPSPLAAIDLWATPEKFESGTL